MKKLWLACLLIASLHGNEAENILGLTGTYKDSVLKFTVPREKIKVNVSGIVLDPFMGLTSWVTFDGSKLAGDLVLFQDEVNPVMTALLNSNIEITALHNHFFYDNPKVYFMHIGGTGTEGELAKGVKKWIDTVKGMRTKFPSPALAFEGHPIAPHSAIRNTPLEAIMGIKGEEKKGMAKYTLNNSWIAFAGTNEYALADGDIAVAETDLQSALKTLRNGNFNIVAIHNHMINETPRMIFVHFWANGHAETLAKTFKEALNL